MRKGTEEKEDWNPSDWSPFTESASDAFTSASEVIMFRNYRNVTSFYKSSRFVTPGVMAILKGKVRGKIELERGKRKLFK